MAAAPPDLAPLPRPSPAAPRTARSPLQRRHRGPTRPRALHLPTLPAALSDNDDTVATLPIPHLSPAASTSLRLHLLPPGCDGSVLIDTVGNLKAEKDDIPNNPSLRFFDVIDHAKASLEAQCPGVVSCADILAFAARDSVVLAGGLGYQVPAGRRDGRISLAKENIDLPAPFFNATQLVDIFARKNLTLEDLVVLSGAHTLGVAHCSTFTGPMGLVDRLYNFSSPDGIDPALSKAYAFLLRSICPANSSQFFPPNRTIFMDLNTPEKFDNKYYVGLTNNLGLFKSDAALLTNATMKVLVDSFVSSEATWKTKFAASMIKMGQIQVLTGTQGEIRRHCRVINPVSTSDALAQPSGSSGFTGVAAS